MDQLKSSPSEIWATQEVEVVPLTAYGVILPSQFDQKVYNIARLKYQDLSGLNAFSAAYEEKSKQHQEELEQVLSDNGKARLQLLRKEGQESLDKGKETLDKAETNCRKASVV